MDTQKILDMMAKNPAAAGVLGGLAGSLLGGAITGRKGGGSLVKMGGLAAVGYVAYQAWQRHQSKQQGQAAAPAPMLAQLPASVPDAFDLNRAANSLGALPVVQAMVAAAKADGVVDASERQRIQQRVDQAGLSPTDRAAVTDIFAEPLSMDAVVDGVQDPALATEIYAASMLAVHPANRAERAYLDMLAARLNIEPGLVAELDKGVTAAVT